MNRSQKLKSFGCKGGREALKIFDLLKGGLEKNTTNCSIKVEFTGFSMGLNRNFHGKKRGDFLKSGGG